MRSCSTLKGCYTGANITIWILRFGSDQFYKIILLPEPWTGLKVRFMPWPELWTGLQSGSQKFRFELWFRTELQNHYFLWMCFVDVFDVVVLTVIC